MPGYNKSRIVGLDQDQLKEFLCGICEEVLNHPFVTQCCRQSYCRQCIDKWVRDENTCPNDRREITLDDLVNGSSFVKIRINGLRIKCELHKKGCDIIVNIEKYKEHWENCKYRICDVCGFKDTDHRVCSNYVVDENAKLKEELDECKSEIDFLNNICERIQRANSDMKMEFGNLEYSLNFRINCLEWQIKYPPYEDSHSSTAGTIFCWFIFLTIYIFYRVFLSKHLNL